MTQDPRFMALFRIAIFLFALLTVGILFLIQRSPKYSPYFRPLVVALVIVNGFGGLLSALIFGTDLPYVDGFGDLRLYGVPFDLRQFTFTTGGHVLAVHPTVYYFVGNATAWNTKFFLVLHWLGFLANAFGIAWLFRQAPLEKEEGKNKPKFLSKTSIYGILGIGLALSLSNSKHWMDTRILAHSITLSLVLLAIFAATHRHWWVRNFCAPLVCFVATFNLAWGLLTWVALAPLVASKIRRDRIGVFIWIGFAVAAISIFKSYFHTGYVDPNPGAILTLRGIGLGILDFIALNVAFLYPANYVKPYEWILIPGFALFGLQVFVTLRAWKKMGFLNWVIHPVGILLIYCTLAGHMATVARSEFATFESQAMRYTSVAIGFSAALLYQLQILDGWNQLKKIVGTLVAASLFVCWPYFLHTVHWFHTTQRKAVACLRSDEPFKDYTCYQNTFPDLHLPDGQFSFRRHVEQMKKEKISVYRYLRDTTDGSISR